MKQGCNECANYERCPCAYDHTVDFSMCFREKGEDRRRQQPHVETPVRCNDCQFASKCDGRLRAQALTDYLVTDGYLDRNSVVIIEAVAKNCKLFKGR